MDFIKCVEEHARVRELGDDATYWICAYANNQHELGADLGTDPRSSSLVIINYLQFKFLLSLVINVIIIVVILVIYVIIQKYFH